MTARHETAASPRSLGEAAPDPGPAAGEGAAGPGPARMTDEAAAWIRGMRRQYACASAPVVPGGQIVLHITALEATDGNP